MSFHQDQPQARSDAFADLRDRVNQSLQKLGYPEARFVDAVDETVSLTCPVANRNDQCVMSAAIRALPGVSAVNFVAGDKASE